MCFPQTERKDFSRKLTYSSFDQLPLKGWGALAWLGFGESLQQSPTRHTSQLVGRPVILLSPSPVDCKARQEEDIRGGASVDNPEANLRGSLWLPHCGTGSGLSGGPALPTGSGQCGQMGCLWPLLGRCSPARHGIQFRLYHFPIGHPDFQKPPFLHP